jgi:hypothetical protein
MKKTTKTKTSRAPAITPAIPPAPAPEAISPPPAPKPVKVVAPPPAATVIAAKVDVGFGNWLALRGDGPGLSWEKGIPLENIGSGEWTVSLPGIKQPVAFKLLINDLTWSSGENFTAAPGGTTAVAPTF